MLNKVKKLISISLLTIYTSIAFGVAINFHYCGGHLAKVSLLNINGKAGCRCNPGAMPMDCCKDKLIIQKADNHRIVQQISIAEFVSLAVEPPVSCNNYISFPGNGHDPDFTGPADFQRSWPEPIYLLNGVFRI